MPTCSICGKNVTMGYTIIRNKVYCDECSEKLDDLLDEIIAEALTQYINTNFTALNIDNIIARYEKKIQELKLSVPFVKMYVLSRVVSIVGGRGARPIPV